MRAAGSIDKLARNPHLVHCLAYAAFKYVTHPKLATSLLHVHGPALVDEARIARDDEQARKARQGPDDVVHGAIRKVFLLGVAAQTLEGQNRDGRLIGEGRIRPLWFRGNQSRLLSFVHIPDEANALPDDRPDEPLVLSIVADRRSRRIDAVAECRF